VIVVNYQDAKMSKGVEKKDQPVGLRLRKSLKTDLDDLAAADRRPLATYIEIVLEEHVAAKKAADKGKRK
jgi:hypothetical protein